MQTILATHSMHRANTLREILVSHGINTDIVPIDGSDGLCHVCISPTDLPLAVKIAESGENYSPALVDMKLAGMSGNILIPVDISDRTYLSCKVGFELARRLGLHPVIMYAYDSPGIQTSFMFADNDDLPDTAMMQEQEEVSVRKAVEAEFGKYIRGLKQMRLNGDVPDVRFSSKLVNGIPEEAILDYARNTPPALIVMSTRTSSRKRREVMGSVTAEVIDSCRVPVYTVPADYEHVSIKDISNLVFFCMLDRQDLLTMQAFVKMFDIPEVDVTLVPISEKMSNNVRDRLERLCDYFSSTYPTIRFHSAGFSADKATEDVHRFIVERKPQLLIVPNKKQSAFLRLFNPSFAHRILFEREIPMLVLPV